MKNISLLISRIFLSIIFLRSAFGKISNFENTTNSMINHGVHFSSFFLVCAIILLIVGGISVLVGYKPQLGAIALIIFLLPVTLIYHLDIDNSKQMTQFYKNLAILGGLLLMSAYGGGDYSLDRFSNRRSES